MLSARGSERWSGTASSPVSPTEISRTVCRRDRMILRASFAATATSQFRIWSGSLTWLIRRQAMAHAACAESSANEGSRQMT